MASSNINKIVQSHANLKPWVLAKNTNEIVNTYIQKMYKQMPQHFKKDKLPKVASPRAENKGPLRSFKSQAEPAPLTVIPRSVPAKKPSKHKQQQQQQQEKNLLNSLKLSTINNVQIASKFSGVKSSNSKRLLKSPNYKIYKSRRFGSSASSSGSSIFRRYEERRRQREHYPAQINYLIRSFHNKQLEPTYARYLMPARNQHVAAQFSSIPDAIKFSHDIQSDLMSVNSITRAHLAKKHSSRTIKTSQVFNKRKEQPITSAPLNKYPVSDLKDSPVQSLKKAQEKNQKKLRLSPEQREYSTINVQRMAQLKHPKPPNEVFTAQHDRYHTELHEKHRRNRMLKLGLIHSPSPVEKVNELEETKITNEQAPNKFSILQQENESDPTMNSIKNTLTLRNSFRLKEEYEEPPVTTMGHDLMEINKNVKFQTSKEFNRDTGIEVKEIKNLQEPALQPQPPSKTTTTPDSDISNCSSSIPIANPGVYNMKSAIATVRAQLPNKTNHPANRYNRADFFSTKKY